MTAGQRLFSFKGQMSSWVKRSGEGAVMMKRQWVMVGAFLAVAGGARGQPFT